MPNEIKLSDVYQEAAVAMSECLRTVADALDANKSLDLTPQELADMISDLISTLMIADMHTQAMAGAQKMMDRGYKSVSIERSSPYGDWLADQPNPFDDLHRHSFVPMNVAGTIVGWCACGKMRGMPPERKDKE